MDHGGLTSGMVLSQRYRLEDQVNESLGAVTWLAHDLVLDRNVGVQALPSDDHRAAGFTDAARRSTTVTDPRFLRVLDVVEDEHGVTYLVREWARAVSLDRVLTHSTLTNRRSATVIAEVAEAIGNAHEVGIFHRHLAPGCVQLKESGAIRITGLAVDHALHAAYSDVDDADVTHAEEVDVVGIGKLLYACLAGRWPGTDGGPLRPAPTEHGRLLRPRQVRAGVSRDVDTVCDRILGTPPRHHEPVLRTARDIAQPLRLAGEDEALLTDDQPSLVHSSPDLFRHDPVTSPGGPPPAVNPPRARPAALAPPPPTTMQRGRARARRATQGDRALVWTGVVVAVALAATLAYIVGRASTGTDPGRPPVPSEDAPTAGRVEPLRIVGVRDFDPEGSDREENPADTRFTFDGKRGTGWRTSEYYSRADLGGLKDGVGLLVDLGGARLVSSVEVTLGDAPTSLKVLVAPGATRPPRAVRPLRRVGAYADAPGAAAFSVDPAVRTRFVVIWLTRLPQRGPGVFQGDVREIVVQGST